MTSKRQAWMFYAHARRLGLPEPVFKYVLRALLDGTAIPVILRGAVEAGAGQNLNPYGVGSQVHRLLCWDYKQYPNDYAANPMNASVCDCVDGRQAVRYHEIGGDFFLTGTLFGFHLRPLHSYQYTAVSHCTGL